MKVSCNRCDKEFKLQSNIEEQYKLDGLCGRCRGRKKYLELVKSGSRKTRQCLSCGFLILEKSNLCYRCANLGNGNPSY